MKNSYDISYTALLCSLLLHLLILYFVVFGVSFSVSPTIEEEVISFDILPASDLSNVPTKKIHQLGTNDIMDAKKVFKTKSDPVPEAPLKEEPKPLLPTPPVVEQSKSAVEKQQEVAKQEMKIKKSDDVGVADVKKPTAAIKQTKPVEKSVVKEQPKAKKKIIKDSELDSLLKTLEQASDGNDTKSNKYAKKQEDSDATQESKGAYNEQLTLSMSEKALITQQFIQYWSYPRGAAFIEQIKITVHMVLNKDGSIQNARITDTVWGAASKDLCKIVVDGANRAMKQVSPFHGLSPERYEIWKEVEIAFTPSQ